MYSTADFSVTPRPMYPADGRKMPDVYTRPGDLRDELQAKLGTFPLFDFWGPRASIESTRWIADAAKIVEAEVHADADARLPAASRLQPAASRPGDPAAAADVRQVDEVCGDLIAFYEAAGRSGRGPVRVRAFATSTTPVHLNRVLREHGLIAVREELGHELLDPGASAAFAVADHQVAHVYVNDPSRLTKSAHSSRSTPGVERVLDARRQSAH